MAAGGRGSGDAVFDGGEARVGTLGICRLDIKGPEYPTRPGRRVSKGAGGLGSS